MCLDDKWRRDTLDENFIDLHVLEDLKRRFMATLNVTCSMLLEASTNYIQWLALTARVPQTYLRLLIIACSGAADQDDRAARKPRLRGIGEGQSVTMQRASNVRRFKYVRAIKSLVYLLAFF